MPAATNPVIANDGSKSLYMSAKLWVRKRSYLSSAWAKLKLLGDRIQNTEVFRIDELLDKS
jgi:hypothetical protein